MQESQDVVMDDVQRIARVEAALAERIGRQRFDLWFGRQTQIRIDDACLVIRVASTFLRDWIRRNFCDDLRACCAVEFNCNATIEFEVDASLLLSAAGSRTANCQPAAEPNACQADTPVAPRIYASPVLSVESDSAIATPAGGASSRGIGNHKTMTFESLVVGRSNKFASHAAEMVSGGLHQASTVLFWGPTGVGKTHLLRGIQSAYRRMRPQGRAIYITAEQFTGGFVDAVRGSGLPIFRQKSRGADLLLLDDVHFFAGKRATLEELLYTIDALTSAGRRLVLASDRPLGQLHALGAELVSRLSAGAVCEIEPPDFSMRVEIVGQLARSLGMPLDDALLQSIATQVTGGARELQGALHRLELTAATTGQPLDQPLVDQALGDIALQHARPVKLADIQSAVCDVFGVDAGGLRSESKLRSLTEPRMLAMWLARRYTRAPWSEIGEFFGGRTHSTVIAAHRRMQRLMSEHGTVGLADRSCSVEDAIRRVETALRRA
jgi:chromosomal replication initiator protein